MEIKDEPNPRKSTMNRHCERYNTKHTTILELIEWTNKDIDALMELVMHLTDEQINLVIELKTSKELWGTLKECHKPSVKTTKINTLRHLVGLEMEVSLRGRISSLRARIISMS